MNSGRAEVRPLFPGEGKDEGQALGQRTGSSYVAMFQDRIPRSTRILNPSLAFPIVRKVYFSGEEDRTSFIGQFASFSQLSLVSASQILGLHPGVHGIQSDPYSGDHLEYDFLQEFLPKGTSQSHFPSSSLVPALAPAPWPRCLNSISSPQDRELRT